MVFSDTTNKAGLIQDCERILFKNYGTISGNTNRLLEFTNLLNQALDETAIDIMRADRNWKWDDRNNTGAPIATTDLVFGQKDYSMDVSFLKVEKVELLTSDNETIVLKDIKETESNESFAEKFKTNSTPEYYELKGDWIYLYPAPNYPKTDGLIVHYQRTFSHFASTDTTKTPGCPSVFHPLITMRACYKYAFAHTMDLQVNLEREIIKYVSNLKNHLRTRNPRGRNKFIPKFNITK